MQSYLAVDRPDGDGVCTFLVENTRREPAGHFRHEGREQRRSTHGEINDCDPGSCSNCHSGLAVVVRAERRLVAAWCRRGRGFIGQALLKRLGRRARMLSEVVGTIGLPASAPASYYAITGNVNATTWILWLANILFAGDQIHYVHCAFTRPGLKASAEVSLVAGLSRLDKP